MCACPRFLRNTTLGRFIGRDPKDYVDGYGIYSAYFAPNAVDPDGQGWTTTVIRGPNGLTDKMIGYESVLAVVPPKPDSSESSQAIFINFNSYEIMYSDCSVEKKSNYVVDVANIGGDAGKKAADLLGIKNYPSESFIFDQFDLNAAKSPKKVCEFTQNVARAMGFNKPGKQ